MAETNISNEISISREKIRKQLLESYAKLLELDSYELDLSDTSFSSFAINALSALASDTFFYGSMLYNETSLVTAVLPESIINWSRYIDYTPSPAIPSEVDILVKIPYATFKFDIDKDHKFYAKNISFRPRYTYTIDTTGTNPSITKQTDTNTVNIPYTITEESNTTYLVFVLHLYQEEVDTEEFTVPQLNRFEYFTKTIDIQDGQYVTSIEVYVDGVKWEESKLTLATANDQVYEWIVLQNKLKILFGNNLFGKQPEGVVTVNITLTNGETGNVGPGTVTSFDPIYVADNPPRRIDMIITNVAAATGGSNAETLTDIKRNAPRSLSMLNRIVSEDDYRNIFYILYGEDTLAVPVLKRSDLAVNDIIVYTSLKWNDEIVPTNSIFIDYDPNVDKISTESVLTFDGVEWICPFTLNIDHTNMIANYVFIPKSQTLTFQEIMSNDSPVAVVTSGDASYDPVTDLYTMNLYVLYSTSGTVTQQLQVRQTGNFYTIDPTSVTDENNSVKKFTYQISGTEIANIKAIDIYTYMDNVLQEVVSTSLVYIDMSKTARSTIVTFSDNSQKITDIPVILKSWYDTLSETDKATLLNYIGSRFLVYDSDISHRMINTLLDVKFIKSAGTLTNLDYSKEDYIVEDVVYGEVTSPVVGKYYAISDPIPSTDSWYQYAGYLAWYDGSSWNFDKPGSGTIIRNTQDNHIYSTDGRRWFKPSYSSPLDVEIEVFTETYDTRLQSYVLDAILNYINNELGIEESLYISTLVSKIHDIDGVKFIRVVKPESDIIYKDVTDNLTKDQLMLYTPEYIYTTKDNIRITITTVR